MKLKRKLKQSEIPARREPSRRGQSAPVFSYYSSRSGSDTPRTMLNNSSVPKKKKSVPWWVGYAPSLLAMGVLVAAGLFLMTLSPNPRIVLSGNQDNAILQETNIYQQAAKDEIERSIFNRTKLTIDTDQIADKLKNKFPELNDIIVTVPLISRRPTVVIQPSRPSLILSGQGSAFVINNSGRPVLKASTLISSVRDDLPVVTDSSNTEIEIGKQLLPTDLVRFIRQIDEQFKEKSIVIEAYNLPALANELHVKPAGEGYIIKFNTESDARIQTGTYLAVIDKLKSESTIPTEYIDVRVEERAYYK